MLLSSQNEKIMMFSKDILLDKLPESLSLSIVKDIFTVYFDQAKTFNDSSMALAK